MEAAGAGHLTCLERFHETGRFLDFYSPERAAAATASKLEAWLAAQAACRGGHAHVVRWLFRKGWPPAFDIAALWHPDHAAKPWMEALAAPKAQEVPFESVWDLKLKSKWHLPELSSFRGEVDLYRLAMNAPHCLVALLEAGARSAWICRTAASEGKAKLLSLAVHLGCPCDPEVFFAAAREGQMSVLSAVQLLDIRVLKEEGMGIRFIEQQAHGLFPPEEMQGRDWTRAAMWERAAIEAAAKGHKDVLQALLACEPAVLCACREVGEAAALAGSLECLKLLERCVSTRTAKRFPRGSQDTPQPSCIFPHESRNIHSTLLI